ncbi:helix-turn-helix domain-containing protein [Enterobacter mori]|uniref:helix-turn-helix domain-containing protein n=2 Tax=Enterobacter mori TaxID=539813 RepID=UPI001BE0C634|nr:AraC family transcriptional regulator [Enterobacter mori]MBT1881911.1 helix-turn-helix transcriptional regulator [Enterobacter mori]MCW4855436.1 helix-turn-helix domain-containing protein [Enterobacter mori]
MKNPRSHMINWSSSDIVQEERFSEFVSLLTKSLISVTTVVNDHSQFWCDMAAIKTGQFSVTDINGSAKHSQRSAKDLARSSTDAYHLVYAGISWLFVNRYGQEIKAPAGSVLLLDTQKIYSSYLPDGFLNRTLTLPREWLLTWVPNPEKIIEMNLCEASGWGKVIAACIDQISPRYLNDIDFNSSLILDQLGSMLSFLYKDVVCKNIHSARFSNDRNYQRIIDSIHHRHMNLLLNAADIAKDVGISIRTLHRVMAGNGTSFGQELINFRAHTALRMLKAKKYDELPISDIAKRAGFVDLSHFSRVCKNYFGESPGQIRKKR